MVSNHHLHYPYLVFNSSSPFLSLAMKEQEERPAESEEISRAIFLTRIDAQLEHWGNKHLEAQGEKIKAQLKMTAAEVEIIKWRGFRDKVLTAEERGMRVEFYQDGDNFGFQIEEREQAGFPSQIEQWRKHEQVTREDHPGEDG